MAFEFLFEKSGITCPSDSSIRGDLFTLFKIVHHSSSLFINNLKGSQKMTSLNFIKNYSGYSLVAFAVPNFFLSPIAVIVHSYVWDPLGGQGLLYLKAPGWIKVSPP